MSDEPEYFILASPQARVVSIGAKVTYTLTRYRADVTAPSQLVGLKWFALNDPKTTSWYQPDMVDGPPLSSPSWKDAEWKRIGHHKIICRVVKDGKTTFYGYEQDVADLLDAAALGPPLLFHKHDPQGTLEALTRRFTTLEQDAKAQPPATGVVLDRHKKQMADLADQRDRLAERLASTQGKHRVILTTEFFHQETQQRVALLAFAVRTGPNAWKIVDWTNPTKQALTGEYDGAYHGEGTWPLKAFDAAVQKWKDGNRYPNGVIRIKIPDHPDLGTNIERTFETHAQGDATVNLLNDISLAAAVVAGVVTLVAPVPGAQVISGAIWLSIFSSSAGALLNIGTRHAEGFTDYKADAFDALTIASNAFGGGALWKRGALVTAQGARGVVTGFLVAQVTADLVQGAIITAEGLQEIDAVNANPELTPSEKLDKRCKILGDLALKAMLLVVNIKGNKADIDNLKSQPKHIPGPTPEQRLEQLKDPNQKVDLREPRKIEGHTKDGTHKTTVQLEQEAGPIHVPGTKPKPAGKKEKEVLWGPFTHQDNKNKMDVILKEGKMLSTTSHANGDEAVRATTHKFQPAKPGQKTSFEFYTRPKPGNHNWMNKWTYWYMPEGEKLDVIVTRIAYDDGRVVELPAFKYVTSDDVITKLPE